MSLFWNDYPYTDFHELNLSWVLEQTKKVIDSVKSIDGWIENHEKEYEELKRLYDEIVSGNFPDSVKFAFEEWMQKNALDLVGELVKSVFFEITDSGYFVAYIPESWDDIIFGTTGLDDFPAGVGYGHLTLTY